MKLEPKLNYFSIWRAAFGIFRRHFRMLLGMLLLAAPFFLLDALLNANQMMTLGSAAMAGSELPPDLMRLLWLSLTAGDTLAFIALTIGIVVICKALCGEPIGFWRQLRAQLPRMLRSVSFWVFALMQFVIFALVNSPEGPLKIAGMILFAVGVLWLLSSQDRDAPAHGKHLRQLNWKGWANLVLVLLTFPIVFILLNGYVNYFFLMLTDLGALQVMHFFKPGSPILPLGVITLSKFLSQWLNLLPMAWLLSTYLAMRGAAQAVPADDVRQQAMPTLAV